MVREIFRFVLPDGCNNIQMILAGTKQFLNKKDELKSINFWKKVNSDQEFLIRKQRQIFQKLILFR